MISSPNKLLVLTLGAVSLWAAGCGNYSNEDLEFMNALPTTGDLSVEIPARSAGVTLREEAELARQTHETTRSLNALTVGLVGLVDAVRSYPPTSRTENGRIWGPFEAGKGDKNPDWLRRMIITRDPVTPTKFTFDLALRKAGTGDTEWITIMAGWFDAGMKARQGAGSLQLRLAEARAAGLDVTEWGQLDHLEIEYQTPLPATVEAPLHIHMDITNMPEPANGNVAVTANYDYLATSAGQGQMTFDLFGNLVPVPPPLTDQIEHVNITSRWLATGEGRGDLTVVSGDGVGAHQQECWDRLFKPTFSSKPWAGPLEQPLSGDASLCVEIPLLSAPAP